MDKVPSFFPDVGGRSQEEAVMSGDKWLPLPFEWVRSASLSDCESGDNVVPLPSAEFILLPASSWGQEDEMYSQAEA